MRCLYLAYEFGATASYLSYADNGAAMESIGQDQIRSRADAAKSSPYPNTHDRSASHSRLACPPRGGFRPGLRRPEALRTVRSRGRGSPVRPRSARVCSVPVAEPAAAPKAGGPAGGRWWIIRRFDSDLRHAAVLPAVSRPQLMNTMGVVPGASLPRCPSPRGSPRRHGTIAF